jgi:hypothetical protein
VKATDFAETYRATSDADLTRLADKEDSLVPEAREALQAEIQRRSTAAEQAGKTEEPPLDEQVPEKQSGFTDWLGRFGLSFVIYIACWALESVIFLAIATRTPGVDQEKLTAAITGLALRASLVMGILTARFRFRTMLLFGVVIPLAFFAFIMLRS